MYSKTKSLDEEHRELHRHDDQAHDRDKPDQAHGRQRQRRSEGRRHQHPQDDEEHAPELAVLGRHEARHALRGARDAKILRRDGDLDQQVQQIDGGDPEDEQNAGQRNERNRQPAASVRHHAERQVGRHRQAVDGHQPQAERDVSPEHRVRIPRRTARG